MSLQAKEFRAAGLRMTIRDDCVIWYGVWMMIRGGRVVRYGVWITIGSRKIGIDGSGDQDRGGSAERDRGGSTDRNWFDMTADGGSVDRDR